jgi:hypothetical protein
VIARFASRLRALVFGLLWAGVSSLSSACGGTTVLSSGGGGNGGSGSGASAGAAGLLSGAGAGGVGVGPMRTQVASIAVSASTNSAAVDVAIYDDASAERTVRSGSSYGNGFSVSPQSFPVDSPEGVAFLADLNAIGDVSSIPTSPCAKSVSFGTTATLTAYGTTSGDLECAFNATAPQVALISDCRVLAGGF